MWTGDQQETLATMWYEGASASEIATKLGYGFTRNAVIGKLHRMGLNSLCRPVGFRRPKYKGQPRRKPDIQRAAAIKQRAKAVSLHQLEIVRHAPAVEDREIPPEQRKQLLELTDDTCRYPVGHPGEADFFFCGAPPLKGSAYCPYHYRVCYTPARESPTRQPFILRRRAA